MMAPEHYIFTGERVPDHITHVVIDRALKFVPARAFYEHPNIQEVICHDGVLKIEREAFFKCPSLQRVIMPGVKVVERTAFWQCEALTNVECGKLERIEGWAFLACKSLSSVDLPSIKIVRGSAFTDCKSLTNANFGKDLESIRREAFAYCHSLERITLPLKVSVNFEGRSYSIIAGYNAFKECSRLKHVDLVGGVHETIESFIMEEWKRDMNEEIDTISQILPKTPWYDPGGKALAIRAWIKSVHSKYTHYKAEHRLYLNVTAALEPVLSKDIVLNNVLPLLSKSFGRGEGE